MRSFLSILFLCVWATSCTKDENKTPEIIQINYGFLFNMCVGYCKHEIKVNSGSAVYTASGWNNSVDRVSRSDKITESEWAILSSGINHDHFFQLPEVFGCPDCADGGDEWIEIKLSSGAVHKVNFEFQKEPDELKPYLIEIRKKFEQLGTEN